MNWDRIEGNWKQFKGKAKEKWGQLTDDELDQIAGRKDQLVGKIQERYGWAKDRAEQEVNDAIGIWYRQFNRWARYAAAFPEGGRVVFHALLDGWTHSKSCRTVKADRIPSALGAAA